MLIGLLEYSATCLRLCLPLQLSSGIITQFVFPLIDSLPE